MMVYGIFSLAVAGFCCPIGRHDPLAQLAEHLTFNQGVPRSSRGWVTSFQPSGTRGRGGMADAPDLGSGAPGRKSSSLFVRTTPHRDTYAVVAQLVERNLAKVEVASPSLVYRSTSELAALCSPPGRARRLTTLRNSSFSVKSRLFTGETGFQGASSG